MCSEVCLFRFIVSPGMPADCHCIWTQFWGEGQMLEVGSSTADIAFLLCDPDTSLTGRFGKQEFQITMLEYLHMT